MGSLGLSSEPVRYHGGSVVDHQLSPEKQEQVEKKTYRKPCVQVYGTLAEITKTAAHHHSGGVDNFGPGWNTRT
jgi:hypothetical protein